MTEQQTGSFGTTEGPKQAPKAKSQKDQPQKVRLDSDPGTKAVIIILSIIVAAILIWVLALGPYMRMG